VGFHEYRPKVGFHLPGLAELPEVGFSCLTVCKDGAKILPEVGFHEYRPKVGFHLPGLAELPKVGFSFDGAKGGLFP